MAPHTTFQPPWKLYGFVRPPFDDIKTPQDYFTWSGVDLITEKMKDALDHRGIHVLLADSGEGKTSALRLAVQELKKTRPQALIIDFLPEDGKRFTLAKIRDRVLSVARKNNILVNTNREWNTDMVRRTVRQLKSSDHYPDGVLLVFDNCHDFGWQLLRGIRQLIEADLDGGLEQHVCGVLFIGWNRLQTKLRQVEDVESRATIHHLPSFTKEDVRAFTLHRISVALKESLTTDDIITDEALDYLTMRDHDMHGRNLRTPIEILKLLRGAFEYAASIDAEKINLSVLLHEDRAVNLLLTKKEELGEEVASYRLIEKEIKAMKGGQGPSYVTIQKIVMDPSKGDDARIALINAALKRLEQRSRQQSPAEADPQAHAVSMTG